MKILFVSPTLPVPPNDGGKIVIFNTYNHLLNHADKVDIISIVKDYDHTIINSPQVKEKFSDIYHDKNISSVRRIVKNLLTNKPILIYKFYSNEFLTRLKNKIKQENYDIIHFEGLHTAPYALKLKKETSAKVVVRLHNLESLIIERYFGNSNNIGLKNVFKREYKKIRNLEYKVFKEIKNIIFITEDDKKLSEIDRIKGTNPLVLNSGVDVSYFSQVTENNSDDLLYLGSMDWKPNEDSVIWFVQNVFNNLIKEKPSVKFYIVGKNPSDKVKSLSSDNIIVTGMVDDVREYINKTGIAVIPIFIGGGMRIKILELMAAGRPIISTSIGAEGINYESNKNILIADNSEQFLSYINLLYQNKELRKTLITGGKQLVNNDYLWDSLILKLVNYYKSI
jgi:polysaccharide biosynthesis protein PslH